MVEKEEEKRGGVGQEMRDGNVDGEDELVYENF